MSTIFEQLGGTDVAAPQRAPTVPSPTLEGSPPYPSVGIFEPRFAEKISADPEGCWLWIACTINGYGRYNLARKGGVVYAHRYAYEQAGTRRDNMRDMVGKGRGHWQRDPTRAREQGRRLGLSQKGEAHSRSRLTAKDVEVIRYLLGRGAFVPDVAACFGVHRTTISDIEHGRKWRG